MKTILYKSAKAFSFLLAVSFILISCQKDVTFTPDNTCHTNMVSLAGVYKLTTMTYKVNPTAQAQDFLQVIPDCEQDDLVTLKADGTYQYRDLGNICDEDGSDTGTWSLQGNVIISEGTISGTIESFDCSTLTCYTANFYVPGDRITFSMKKQ